MAPLPAASTRPDEAELMWIDDADLMSVSEPHFAAAKSGSVFAKCIVPSLGLFVAVLFGHIILTASQLPQPPAAAVKPPAAAPLNAQPLEPQQPSGSPRPHSEDGAQGSGAS